jgi:predicted transcriptional regulator
LSTTEANREKIRAAVSLIPGLHLRLLQRVIGLSFNSTRYHVGALSKNGEIIRDDKAGYSRLYPVGTTDSEKAIYSAMRNKTDRLVLTTLLKEVKVSRRQLGERTGLAKSTMSEHISKLVRAGIVIELALDTNRLELVLTDPLAIKKIVDSQNQTFLREATDRFIDLWEF